LIITKTLITSQSGNLLLVVLSGYSSQRSFASTV